MSTCTTCQCIRWLRHPDPNRPHLVTVDRLTISQHTTTTAVPPIEYAPIRHRKRAPPRAQQQRPSKRERTRHLLVPAFRSTTTPGAFHGWCVQRRQAWCTAAGLWYVPCCYGLCIPTLTPRVVQLACGAHAQCAVACRVRLYRFIAMPKLGGSMWV